MTIHPHTNSQGAAQKPRSQELPGNALPARLRLASPLLILSLLITLPGCVTTQPWVANCEPPGPVCQVHTYWEGRIRETQDVVNSGRPLPGLAGRVYLFGPEIKFPEKGDGKLAVDLYDISDSHPGAKPRHIQHVEFDPVSLKQLLRKDKIGWGYTVFLPWPDYRPDIGRIQLNVCYTPANGTPLYAEPTPITLGNEGVLTQTHTRQVFGTNGAGQTKQ